MEAITLFKNIYLPIVTSDRFSSQWPNFGFNPVVRDITILQSIENYLRLNSRYCSV